MLFNRKQTHAYFFTNRLGIRILTTSKILRTEQNNMYMCNQIDRFSRR